MEDQNLWPFMSLPTANGDRLTRHPADAQAHREEMEKLGWRLQPELATHRLTHPGGDSFPWLASMGLDLEEVTAPTQTDAPLARPVPDISGLSLEQKTDLLMQLRRDGFGGHDTAPPDLGDVATVSYPPPDSLGPEGGIVT